MTNTIATPEAASVEIAGRQFTSSQLLKFMIQDEQWETISATLRKVLVTTLLSKYVSEKPREGVVLDRAMKFRQESGLLSRESLAAWLRQHRLSPEGLHNKFQYEVWLDMLKEKLFADTINDYFERRKVALNQVELYSIFADDESSAKMIAKALQEGESFYELARRHSTDESTRKACGYVGIVSIISLAAKEQEQLATASAGDVIGPNKMGGGYRLIKIDKLHPAVLNKETRTRLMDELFDAFCNKLAEDNKMRVRF